MSSAETDICRRADVSDRKENRSMISVLARLHMLRRILAADE
jgi:hypothetical protein